MRCLIYFYCLWSAHICETFVWAPFLDFYLFVCFCAVDLTEASDYVSSVADVLPCECTLNMLTVCLFTNYWGATVAMSALVMSPAYHHERTLSPDVSHAAKGALLHKPPPLQTSKHRISLFPE